MTSPVTARASDAEPHLFEAEPAGEEGEAQDQQQVAHDRPDQRRLDDREVAGGDKQDPDDELGQVAEGGIDKAAEAGADADGDLLGGASDQGRQGHDRQGRRDEDRDAEAQQLGAQRDGHEDQQPVERRNK